MSENYTVRNPGDVGLSGNDPGRIERTLSNAAGITALPGQVVRLTKAAADAGLSVVNTVASGVGGEFANNAPGIYGVCITGCTASDATVDVCLVGQVEVLTEEVTTTIPATGAPLVIGHNLTTQPFHLMHATDVAEPTVQGTLVARKIVAFSLESSAGAAGDSLGYSTLVMFDGLHGFGTAISSVDLTA